MATIVPTILVGAALAATAQSVTTGSSGTKTTATIQIAADDSDAPKPPRSVKRVPVAPSPHPTEVRALAFSGHPFWPAEMAQAGKALIVQTSKFDAKAAENLREDMAVMSRILDKACGERANESERVLGLDIMIHGGRGARNMFIEDYGVLFMLDVGMPLKPQPVSDEKEESEEARANAEWESARNELFGGRRSMAAKLAGRGGRSAYNEEEVTRLKKELIDAMRNASNIRGLKESHWVTIVVRGRANPWVEPSDANAYLEQDADSETIMVIKVRKGEIDAMAKGVPREEFRKRVSVQTY